ncbi:MAG: hypothetical protein AB7Q42_15825 [Acidimicrobiia bacterium]
MSWWSSLAAPERRPYRFAMVGVVALVAIGWWWWPTFTGQAAGTDVVIVSDPFLASAEREMTYRIHEDGFSLAWAPTIATWCDVPAAVRAAVEADAPSRVVVSALVEGTCGTAPEALRGEAVQAAGGARAVVVVQPGDETTAAALSGFDAVVVEPSRLLGMPDTPEQPCQWWDTCPPSGEIAVRDEAGTLSPAGATRVARMTVTALR